MVRQLRSLFSLILTLFLLLSVLTTLIWYNYNDSKKEPQRASAHKNSATDSDKCTDCRENIDKVIKSYSQSWKKQEENFQKFRSLLSSRCNGFNKAIVTQANTPVGSSLVYDGERRRVLQVNKDIFSTFQKSNPFSNKTMDTCAVVGNGGILVNSSCGEAIDAAQFVIRCNLPPLHSDYRNDVGGKTDLVTANPSIFKDRYGDLMGRRRPFVESLKVYGSALLLIPAFSYHPNTPRSMRAFYSIEDFQSDVHPVFFHPEYAQKMSAFWRSQGLKAGRVSTGLFMASLALELCNNVQLYGFWPFSTHPYGPGTLTNHYYDDKRATKVHAMSVEFELLLKLHNEGVLKLNLGQCPPQQVLNKGDEKPNIK